MPFNSENAQAKQKLGGAHDRDFVIVNGMNSTLITSTTGQSILAAPGAGKHFEVMFVLVANKTAAEVGFLFLQEDVAGTQKAAVAFSGPADGAGNSVVKFDPPLRFAANTGVFGETDSVGDLHVTVIAMKVTD